MIMKILGILPSKSALIATACKCDVDTVLKHLSELIAAGRVEKLEGNYYGRTDINYLPGLDKNIKRVPICYFKKLNSISRWAEYADTPARRQAITDFRRCCYGELATSFVRHPDLWAWPESWVEFMEAYREEHGESPPINVRKALREAAAVILNIDLRNRINENQARLMGLTINDELQGQYRHIRLTLEEVEKAIAWVGGEQGNAAAEKESMEHERLKAHFAMSLEGVSRPSRLLTVACERVERHAKDPKNFDANKASSYITWTQLETKNSRFYRKYLMDASLYEWVSAWLDRRRSVPWRYLFLDDDSYVIRKHDSPVLAPERGRYTRIYKELFRYLGKTDPIWYRDTLYCWRHVSAHYWVQRYGLGILPILTEMGWESPVTLTKFYLEPTEDAIRQFLSAPSTTRIQQPDRTAP